uniref:Uncharacterized protein n=1 Tax=Glossina pallidipes TaxID=7398 RepID=A0A1A9ZIL7_GLOPL
MCVNPKSSDELRGQKFQRIGCLFGRYGLGNATLIEDSLPTSIFIQEHSSRRSASQYENAELQTVVIKNKTKGFRHVPKRIIAEWVQAVPRMIVNKPISSTWAHRLVVATLLLFGTSVFGLFIKNITVDESLRLLDSMYINFLQIQATNYCISSTYLATSCCCFGGLHNHVVKKRFLVNEFQRTFIK